MIPLFKPYMPKDIVTDELENILYSGQLAFGKWGRQFEVTVQNYLENPNTLIVNSYANAVYIAFHTLGIKQGDEIILSPMCCLQSTQPLLTLGVKIVWADIDPETGTLCPESVISKITSATKAIYHNHHLGYVGYIKQIADIARQYELLVIDDCIDGMGGEYCGHKIGNIGSDATIFSFGAVRLPNAIDTAAISFADDYKVNMAKKLRDLGVDRSIFRDRKGEISLQCDVSMIGFAGLPNEISSYIGYQQMNDLGLLFSKQNTNAENWENFIKQNNLNCRPLKVIDKTLPNYWVYGLLSDESDKLIDFFKNIGYSASRIHLNNNCYSVFGQSEELRGVNKFRKNFLAVPCGWWVHE